MSTNSKYKIFLCLALPIALTIAYVSHSYLLTNTTSFIVAPAPIGAPVSRYQEADMAINNEILRMALADTNTDYHMSASAHNGVVTLDFTSTNRLELQHVVNELWQLRGVEQVKNEHGVDLASTLPAVTMAH